MADRLQQRRDTAARWAEFNPVLLEGELGYVTDNPNQYKLGDGIHSWNELPLRGYTGTISQEFGTDAEAVVSQKVVTEEKQRRESAEATLQENIDSVSAMANNNNQIIVTQGKEIAALVAQQGSLSLTVTPDVIYRNAATGVTVKAVFGSKLDADAKGDIKILKGSEVVMRESGVKEVSYSDTVNSATDVAYSAETVYSGKTLTAGKTLAVVDPIFVGTSTYDSAASSKGDIAVDANMQTPRKSVSGTYKVTVPDDVAVGAYVWIFVPTSITTKTINATLNGFDFPLENGVIVFVGGSNALNGGVQYRAFRSSNMMVKGTYDIVVE